MIHAEIIQEFIKKTFFILITIMTICVMLLSSTLYYYNINQKLINEASNNLYTNNHITIKQTFNAVRENDLLNEHSYRLFITINNNYGENIRGYYSNDYNSWAPPLSAGDFFNESDTNEAVIGKKINAKDIDGEKYYEYGGNKYKVTGYLGIMESNYLDNMVIINSNELFSLNDILTIDGKAARLLKKQAEGLEQYSTNKGIGRIVNADFFSKTILGFGIVILLSSLFVISYLFNVKFEKENYILYLIGIKSIHILKKNIFTILFILILSSLIFCVLNFIYLNDYFNIKSNVIICTYTAICVLFHYFFIYNLRKKSIKGV